MLLPQQKSATGECFSWCWDSVCVAFNCKSNWRFHNFNINLLWIKIKKLKCFEEIEKYWSRLEELEINVKSVDNVKARFLYRNFDQRDILEICK